MLTPADKLLLVNVVAKRLNKSVKSVRRLIHAGELAAYNIGTQKHPEYRVSERDYRNYLRKKFLTSEKTL
jgi:excisionase family DNA binding protein